MITAWSAAHLVNSVNKGATVLLMFFLDVCPYTVESIIPKDNLGSVIQVLDFH